MRWPLPATRSLWGKRETVYEDGNRDKETFYAVPSVAPSDEDASSLRFQRPPGLSDADWDRVRQEMADYLDFQISKAAKER